MQEQQNFAAAADRLVQREIETILFEPLAPLRVIFVSPALELWIADQQDEGATRNEQRARERQGIHEPRAEAQRIFPCDDVDGLRLKLV